ncbi:hypothetical protein [Sphingomonas sp. LHG3406-1]|uniref:hypothetical protein n=1 Tax=Sphingomonas sp. LHG3406-1 TaxID=2804617 RepID=UPI00260D2A36|nr:hypothetical protein [Sphingomonas sp. LHG3406-1]
MKSEPRPFASLSSGLLARKGAARPAMRPQGFGQGGSGLEDLGWNDMGFEPPRPVLAPVPVAEEAVVARPNPVTGLTPASPVHAVQDEIVQRLVTDSPDEEMDETAEPVAADVPPLAEVLTAKVEASVAPVAAVAVPARRPVAAEPTPRSRANSGKPKAAFTLRLDHDRHLKLRLACAVTGTSAQQLVTRALDELLATMPELDAMASRAPERHASKR